MGAAPTYPKRPKFFAMRFCRLVMKACVANELGPDAAMLLMAVATTEDARGYRGPVNFWNSQLIPLVGCKSESTLKRVRAKCAAAGWLVYDPGSRAKPPTYRVAIPAGFEGWDDAPTDDDAAELRSDPAHIPPTGGRNPDSIRTQSEPDPDSIRPTSFPIPIPKDPPPPRDEPASEPAVEVRTPPRISEVVDFWNAHPKLPKVVATSPGWGRFLTVLAGSDHFCDCWRDAIRGLAASPHHCGENRDGWKATIDWFLKPDNFARALNLAANIAPAQPPAAPRRSKMLDCGKLDGMKPHASPYRMGGSHGV